VSASEQARADAFADAETLRLLARDNDYMLWHGLGLREILREASHLWKYPTKEDYAINARAAFRAVPGLRGAL